MHFIIATHLRDASIMSTHPLHPAYPKPTPTFSSLGKDKTAHSLSCHLSAQCLVPHHSTTSPGDVKIELMTSALQLYPSTASRSPLRLHTEPCPYSMPSQPNFKQRKPAPNNVASLISTPVVLTEILQDALGLNRDLG
jgi:hypothetical protein